MGPTQIDPGTLMVPSQTGVTFNETQPTTEILSESFQSGLYPGA